MAIVTLVSGGIDSTVMTVLAQEGGAKIHPLFVDYGQRAVAKEWRACRRTMKGLGLDVVTRIDVSSYGKTIRSGLTDRRLRLNEDAFLPGRNLMLLLIGSAHAFRVGANAVAIGLLDPRSQLFPDQTQEFVTTSQKAIQVALGSPIKILAPLIGLTKREVLDVAKARQLTQMYSCHAGLVKPCGKCIACLEINRSRKES